MNQTFVRRGQVPRFSCQSSRDAVVQVLVLSGLLFGHSLSGHAQTSEITLTAATENHVDTVELPGGAIVSIHIADNHDVPSRTVTVRGTCVSYRTVCKGLDLFGFCLGYTQQEADEAGFAPPPRDDKAKPFQYLAIKVAFTTRRGAKSGDSLTSSSDTFVAPEPGTLSILGLVPSEGHFSGLASQPGTKDDQQRAVAEVDAGCSGQGKQRKGNATVTFDSRPPTSIGTWKATVSTTVIRK